MRLRSDARDDEPGDALLPPPESAWRPAARVWSVVVGADGVGRQRRVWCRRFGRRRRGGRRRFGVGDLLVELFRQRALRLRGLDAGAPQLIRDEREHQQAESDEGAPDATDHPSPVVGRLGAIPVADLFVTCGGLFGHGGNRFDVLGAGLTGARRSSSQRIDAIGTIESPLDTR